MCGGVEEKVVVVSPSQVFFFFFLGLEVGGVLFFFFFLSAENWPVKCMGNLVGWLDQLHLRVRSCDGQTRISSGNPDPPFHPSRRSLVPTHRPKF